ncbi:MAG: WYL domain-containing protein, partial [Elusimicrobia bacterium]|nr:WYL domain-containing protein [Elusimicrobiota bacterium]
MTEQNITFFDVETTGLDPGFGDRICEIAILRCTPDLKICDTFRSFVNPERTISPGAFQINGITIDMVNAAPLFKFLAENVLSLLDNSVVVCHNAPFDLSFLEFELSRINIPMINNGVIDTLKIARKHFNFVSNGLQNIARDLGIKVEEKHRALADVVTTRKVLQYFWKNLSKDGRPGHPGDPTIFCLVEKSPTASLCRNYEKSGTTNGSSAQKRYPALPPALDEIITSGRMVQIKYLSRGGVLTKRTVEPTQVLRRRGHLYLMAFCHVRQETRIFRIDRIIKMKICK